MEGATMNDTTIETFDYNSLRAREARLGKKLGKKIVTIVMILFMVLLLAGGVYLLIIKNSIGFSLMSVALILLMFVIWTKKELVPVPALKTKKLNDLLSNDVLAGLPKNPTNLDIAHMVIKTNSGMFLAVRYGITPAFLENIAKDLPENPNQIFQTALKIQQGTDSEEIHGAIMAVSLIANHSQNELILKQMKLELKDLLDGIIWFNYLNGLVSSIGKRRHSGGIARDLSFGYIPVLQKFGVNISRQREGAIKTQIQQSAHKEILEKMTQIFTSGGRQNVALIGPEGSGRTTIVTAFAEQLMDADSKLPNDLKFRQIFKLDAAALVSATSEPGQIEGLVNHILSEAYSAKNIIIWLENAELFFEEGVGSVDITNLLLPILEAGKLRIILTLDQQKFLEISAKKSSLANTLNKIMVVPANEEETMKVMQDQVPFLEYKHKVSYTIWALKESYRLGKRYIHNLEMPGQAVTLLEMAGGYAENKLVTAESVQKAVEKTEGVKVQVAENSEDKDKLLNLEELIHKQMVDQEAAVKTVSDALRRAAAGVRNQNRPIGTFLFLGPTGVGKTELAKALSRVYFSGEEKIIRLDLNEFVEAKDVSRLIADAASDPLSLTAQVMKQPFSVVLLDEIEKAHPQVLTTLLQMLDEGILRDVNNKEVSFRDTIVVATSNAGAEKIREYVSSGVNLATAKDDFMNYLLSSNEFRPEFLNRFDEICLFKPLSPADCMQILDLNIASTNKTLASQKISVVLDNDAKKILVEKGYDPQLGARPMKRIVQKTVENIVAKNVLSGRSSAGSEIKVTREMIAAELGEM